MFLVPINISTFYFSPYKIFLQLLVPIKFLIITFGPLFFFCSEKKIKSNFAEKLIIL